MKRVARPELQNRVLQTLFMLCIVATFVVGCASNAVNQGMLPSVDTPAPSLNCYSQRPLAIYIGVDDAKTYKKQFFTQGLNRLADFFDQLASTPGFGGASIFIGRIHDNSFDTNSLVQSFSIPPISCPPAILLTPTPTIDNSDPAGSEQAQSNAGNAIATATALWNEKNQSIAKEVLLQTDQMRSLPYLSENPDEKDVYGAIHRAAVDLGNYAGAERWLILLSDLQDKENFKWSEPEALVGDRILVLYYACNFGSNFKVNDTCNQHFWERYFQSVGIRSQDMQFLTPELSETAANPFM